MPTSASVCAGVSAARFNRRASAMSSCRLAAAIQQPTLSAAAVFDQPVAFFGSELEIDFDGDGAVPFDTSRVDLDRVLFVFPVRRSVYNNCVAFHTLKN